jgi:hypothetical protein
MARAQFIIEFLILLVFAVLVGTIYLFLTGALASDEGARQHLLAVDDLGYRIQDELLLAATMRDGYERMFVLPPSVSRFTYSVTSDGTSITLHSGRIERTYPTPTFSGTFALGNNTISKRGAITVVPQ